MSFDFKKYLTPWKEEKFVANLPSADYHNEPALSAGQIKTVIDEGVHKLHAYKNGLLVKKETEALRFGNIFHTAVLEGPEFLRRYRVMPEFTGFTKDGKPSTQSADCKAKRSAWLLDQPKDAIIVNDEIEKNQIAGMMGSVMRHPVAKMLLQGGKRELSGFFNYGGFRCRIRIDIFQEETLLLIDLKTTQDANPQEFERQAINELYPIQCSFYCRAATALLKKPIKNFIYITVEKEFPYLCEVYPADVAFISIGDHLVDLGMLKLKTAIETDYWLPRTQEARDLSVPEWFINKVNGMEA